MQTAADGGELVGTEGASGFHVHLGNTKNLLDSSFVCLDRRSRRVRDDTDSSANERRGRSLTNTQLLHKWRVLPARAEIAIRRIQRWQDMTKHNRAHLQAMTAIWGHLLGWVQTLSIEGYFHQQQIHAQWLFSADLLLFSGQSGTEDFFELQKAKLFYVVSIVDDEDVRDFSKRTNLELMREATFPHQTCWNTLTERTITRGEQNVGTLTDGRR